MHARLSWSTVLVVPKPFTVTSQCCTSWMFLLVTSSVTRTSLKPGGHTSLNLLVLAANASPAALVVVVVVAAIAEGSTHAARSAVSWVPLGQRRQPCCPYLGWEKPLGHSLHLLVPGTWYVPG